MTPQDRQRRPGTESVEEKLAELRERREAAAAGGGPERVRAQHGKGKMTARERLAYLFDDGTFEEFEAFAEHRCTEFGLDERTHPGDAVVTGYGAVDGRDVLAFAHDFTVLGGSVSSVVADKVNRVLDKAIEVGVPVVGLADSGGARIQEGVDSLAGFARTFRKNTAASGVVPQISAIMGPCAGGAVYSPALTDFTFMVEDTSHMFVTGPDVVETVTGEQVSMADLGGAATHAGRSGVAHWACDSGEEALDGIRTLLSYLPSNNMSEPPRVEPTDDPDRRDEDLARVVPADPKKPYDVREVLDRVLDRGSPFEVQPSFARNVVVGFARLDGRSVGVVANQPTVNAGTLDVDASEKAARFVRFCDAFSVPILTFVDVPGFLPGTDQEHDGIIRRGAKLIYAYAEATVPLLTVVLRKAYGGAYIVMASKDLGADAVYAWPHAEIAVMGPQGAVNVLHRREIEAAADPEARRDELVEAYREEFANPYTPAEKGHVDDVIDPADTRRRLVRDLGFHDSKRVERPQKRHGNVPL